MLDDISLNYGTIHEVFDAFERFLKICVQLNLRLHLGKWFLFASSVRWYGRLIDENGWRFDPQSFEFIRNMSPRTGAHLQQFVCALNLLRTSISNFASLVAALQDFLENLYAITKKRTRCDVSRIQLTRLNWGMREQTALDDCKRAITSQVTLACAIRCSVFVYTRDVSDDWKSGIATEVPAFDLQMSHAEKRYTTGAFLSCHLNATQFFCSMPKKETFPAVDLLAQLHCLSATPSGFDLITGHNNLIFISDRRSLLPDLSRSSVCNVPRWFVRLSSYNYFYHRISGEDSIWADLLRRWSVPPTVERLLSILPLTSLDNDGFYADA